MKDVSVTILANHPDIVIDKENQRGNVRVIMNTTRMPHAWGRLAFDWNFCLLDGFKTADNPDNVDWVVLAQNDVEWLEGWDEWLRGNKDYDFISQPRGDQAMAFTINAVRNIGFFDENFATLCFQEIDYFIRANMRYAERSSINDDHWKHNFTVNPVGNVLTKTVFSVDVNDPSMRGNTNYRDSLDYINNKYNIDVLEIALKDIKSIGCHGGEFDLYPFFWHNSNYGGGLFKSRTSKTDIRVRADEVGAANPFERTFIADGKSLIANAILKTVKGMTRFMPITKWRRELRSRLRKFK